MSRFNDTSKSLQNVHINLGTVIVLNASVSDYLTEIPNRFDELVLKMAEITRVKFSVKNYKEKRKQKRKPQFSECLPQKEIVFNQKNKLRIEGFYLVTDLLQLELKRRKEAYTTINDNFSFLMNLGSR